MAQGEHGDGGFQPASSAEQMSGHRLGRTHREFVLPEEVADGVSLERVAAGSRGAVGVYVVDLVWSDACIAHGVAHYAETAFMLTRGLRHVVSISAHSVPRNLGEDRSATL